MSESLIQPTALFAFEVPCRSLQGIWQAQGEIELPQTHRIPSFSALDERPTFGDLRIGWSPQGFGISLVVQGKTQLPWCRTTRLDASDGLALWINTRDTHNIHRANRFCHQFLFLPMGRGQRMDQPVAEHMMIPRSTENPKSLPAGALQIRSQRRKDGYAIRAAIPAVAMTGFDPTEHRRLGFGFAVMDRELGWHTFSLGPEYPIASDPSLWGTLVLSQ
jgi:hypothetical protein